MVGVTFTQNNGAIPEPNPNDTIKKLKKKGWRDKIVERKELKNDELEKEGEQ